MMFNISKFFKRAQAGKGIWVGIDPLIFVLRHHPRARDVHHETHHHIRRGVYGHDAYDAAEGHGNITWHAADMSPRLWLQVSMPNDDVMVVEAFHKNDRPAATQEELEEAGRELVQQLSGHGIKLAGEYLLDGNYSGNAHQRFVRMVGLS